MDHERMQQYAQAVALAQLRQSMPGIHPESKAAQPDASQVNDRGLPACLAPMKWVDLAMPPPEKLCHELFTSTGEFTNVAICTPIEYFH